MSTSTTRLLSPTFISEALTQEVHDLLSADYVREILEALAKNPDGVSARWIDVNVVGERGSNKTAFACLNRLHEAGWALAKGSKGTRTWFLSDRGRKALEYAKDGDRLALARGEP